MAGEIGWEGLAWLRRHGMKSSGTDEVANGILLECTRTAENSNINTRFEEHMLLEMMPILISIMV